MDAGDADIGDARHFCAEKLEGHSGLIRHGEVAGARAGDGDAAGERGEFLPLKGDAAGAGVPHGGGESLCKCGVLLGGQA